MIMKILNKIKMALNVLRSPAVDLNSEELLEWMGIKNGNSELTSEVTYYTCLKMLSETMGKLPLKYYKET